MYFLYLLNYELSYQLNKNSDTNINAIIETRFAVF